MAINPITWIDDTKQFVTPELWTIFNIKQQTDPVVATKVTTPEPTVATPSSPIVNRWTVNLVPPTPFKPEIWTVKSDTAQTMNGWVSDKWEIDLRTTKIWEVLSDAERKDLAQKEIDRIRWLEWISFQDRQKEFQGFRDSLDSWAFFWWETQIEIGKQRALEQEQRIKEQSWQAINTAEDAFAKQLALDTQRIQESGQKTMDTTQRLNSLRWGGRSTANEAIISEQQNKINEMVSIAQQNSNLQLQIRKMEIEWATWEALKGVRDALASNEKVLNQRISEAQTLQKNLNDAIGADFTQAMDASLWLLEAGWEDISGIDQTKSSSLWYFVNQDGSIYLNNSGNPVEFKTSVGSWEFTPLEIDAFAKWISDWTTKFSDLKLDNRDIAKVISAMNTKLDTTPWLSTNSLKAQRILKDLWLWVDDEAVRTVTNLLKVNSESEVRDMIATDEFKTGSFVAWNQKLFDDLRKDAESFKDIDRSYKWMNDIFNDFKTNPSENRAAMEQALIIMFNKMLDPWSVVREWEFDRTSEWQSTLNTAIWFLQRLVSGWAWITDAAFADIVNIAWVLHSASQDTVLNLKDSYKTFAWDLWADPKFVDRFFEIWFDKELPADEKAQLESIFWWWTPTWTPFKTSSGFEFDFKSPDKTGWTNDIPVTWFAEKINISRTWTNVAKDTNNPWNITADSIPSWQSKEQYWKAIWATWTYLSPNGREYFIFPDVTSWTSALERDIKAKISGGSRNIKPTDTLARFQRVYVWEISQNYLDVLKRITWANENTPIKNIDPKLLTQAVMKAEWFIS